MDDNYVSSDKIGTGNYFWAFPGSQGAQAKKQLDEARANLKRAQDRLAKAKVAEQEAKAGREDTDGSRAAKLKKLAGGGAAGGTGASEGSPRALLISLAQPRVFFSFFA